MLQRPRNILSIQSSPQSSQATPNWTPYHYHDTPVLNKQLTRLCQFNYNSWDKTKAQLAARWEKTIALRRRNSLKRSMVKRLASGKQEVSDQVSARRKGASSVVTRDSAHGGGPRLREDVCEERSNQAYVGRDQGKLPDCGPARNTGPMEKNKTVVATKRSRGDRKHQEGDRILTPEEYITHRRDVAVERVMSGFQKWLDKRLAILSYTIEASEASDDTGTSTQHKAGSQSRDTGEKKSGGSSGRPKRQLSDNNDPDEFSGGGDDNGQDRGGNKRAKTDTDPEEVKLACPFHKHNPKAHKKELCMKGGWKSIHRLKEHLYRVHLLPKHNCPRCNSCFENDKELQVHLRADEPCKKSNVAPAEGIDQDTERKLRERKKHNSGQTETQRWNDIYLLLFPGADRNAIPSPYPDYDETATRSKNLERYKRVETRIKKELPRLVRQRVERKFEKVEAEMLHGINDIIRNCLSDFFRNNMSQDEGSSATTTPQNATRATTPALTSVEEPRALSFETAFEPQISVDYLLDDPDLGFGGELSLFDYNPQLADYGADGYGGDKVSSDSGYVSTSTMTGYR